MKNKKEIFYLCIYSGGILLLYILYMIFAKVSQQAFPLEVEKWKKYASVSKILMQWFIILLHGIPVLILLLHKTSPWKNMIRANIWVMGILLFSVIVEITMNPARFKLVSSSIQTFVLLISINILYVFCAIIFRIKGHLYKMRH